MLVAPAIRCGSYGFSSWINPKDCNQATLMGVINNLGCLIEHFCLVLAAEENGVPDTKTVRETLAENIFSALNN
jgi:hypothetical protein